MLDLDTGVDLNEVVPAHLVDQEFGSACIPVPNALRELNSITKDGPPNLLREMRCRSDLDDLLVTTLNGAVTLEKVDGVANSISEDLDLNVTRALKEALDEDSAIAERRLSLGNGALEGVLEVRLLAYDAHSTSSTTHRGLDDDYRIKPSGQVTAWYGIDESRLTGESVLVDERIGLGPGGHWARCTRHDGNADLHGCELWVAIQQQSGAHVARRRSPIVRALVLSPSWSMTSGEGPTNARPACSTLRANSAFSERKPYLSVRKAGAPDSEDHRSNGYGEMPYPGWIMSTPCSRAIRMISSCAR